MHSTNAKVSVFLRGTRISKSVSKNCWLFFQTFPPTSILSLIGQYHMYLFLSRVEDTIELWDEEIERNNLNLIIQKQMGLICKTLFPGNPGTAQIVSLRDWELLNMPHFPTWKLFPLSTSSCLLNLGSFIPSGDEGKMTAVWLLQLTSQGLFLLK